MMVKFGKRATPTPRPAMSKAAPSVPAEDSSAPDMPTSSKLSRKLKWRLALGAGLVFVIIAALPGEPEAPPEPTLPRAPFHSRDSDDIVFVQTPKGEVHWRPYKLSTDELILVVRGIRDEFTDAPSSLIFGPMRARASNFGVTTVCGAVNFKNDAGRYVGNVIYEGDLENGKFIDISVTEPDEHTGLPFLICGTIGAFALR